MTIGRTAEEYMATMPAFPCMMHMGNLIGVITGCRPLAALSLLFENCALLRHHDGHWTLQFMWPAHSDKQRQELDVSNAVGRGNVQHNAASTHLRSPKQYYVHDIGMDTSINPKARSYSCRGYRINH